MRIQQNLLLQIADATLNKIQHSLIFQRKLEMMNNFLLIGNKQDRDGNGSYCLSARPNKLDNRTVGISML